MKGQKINHLKDNRQKHLHDLGIGEDFLNRILTMKSTNPKENADKLNCYKIFLFKNIENENARCRGRKDLQYIYIS